MEMLSHLHPLHQMRSLRSELPLPDAQACGWDGSTFLVLFVADSGGLLQGRHPGGHAQGAHCRCDGPPEFDEELFNQQLAYATVPADNQIVFHFRDGREVSRTFVQKRQMPRQTEERKKHMSEVMKAKWRERHAEND